MRWKTVFGDRSDRKILWNEVNPSTNSWFNNCTVKSVEANTMYKTIRWLLLSTTLFVGASAIVSYPAKAFEANKQEQTPVSFELAQASVQQDNTLSDTSTYNFSINYSDRRPTSDRPNSTWTQNTPSDATASTVSIPEPSTLVGLIGFSALFAFKRKSLRKA